MPLNFLMRIQHMRLPLRVETVEEIRLVIALLATGLIEAEILPHIGAKDPYVQPREATVICITEEGMAELDRWIGALGSGRR